MATAIVQSIGLMPAIGAPHLTLAHYVLFITDAEFRDSLLVTFGLATVATLLSAIAGLALALGLRRAVQRRPLLGVLAQVPLAMPHIVMALFVLELISPSGLLARLLYAAGLIHTSAAFPALTNDRLGIGIIIAYILKEAPFVALMVLAVLLRLDDDYDAAARTLGASRWQRLRYVTLPLVSPALVSSSLVVFAFIGGAYEVPLLLGRQYPAMLPVVAQRKFLNVDLSVRPDAIAIGMLIALLTAIFVVGYMRLARALSTSERVLIF
jgi:putative spermidine/putrescine transport system permease protein